MSKNTKPSRRVKFREWGIVLFVAFLLLVYAGRRRSIRIQAERAVAQRQLDAEKRSKPRKDDEDAGRPRALENLTAETLLRETIHAYVNAKYYVDDGRIEYVCEEESTREKRVYRVPCSTAFAKPNYFRVRLGASVVRSDGAVVQAEIARPEFENKLLERPAPLVVAAIREFYPDALFTEYANLGLPPNLLLTSPQLVLLFAKDPKKTLAPNGAKMKLLAPAFLRYRKDDAETSARSQARECDRLQIAGDDGTRTLWIDRETKALARIELPIEQTPAPRDGVKLLSTTIDFPNQRLEDAAPTEFDEFRFDAKTDREVVERFLPAGVDLQDENSPATKAYYAGVGRYAELLNKTELDDVYRLSFDYREPVATAARAYPKTFGMRELWRVDGLNASGEVLTVEGARDEPDEVAYVVPCDGNALALLDRDGRLIRKTTAAAATGEPITFVRCASYGDGKRYYIASSRGRSSKLHRFDENFNDLGSLDVGKLQDGKVGDALLADVDDDGLPEIVLSVLNEPGSARNSHVYAIRSDTRKVLWSNDSLTAPTQLSLFRDVETSEAPITRLAALDKHEGATGAIALLDLATGERVETLRAANADSIKQFCFADHMPDDSTSIAALISRAETSRAAFVGLERDGGETWETTASRYNDAFPARIAAANVNKDSYDEWLVASPDGSIYFVDAYGKPFDLFRYGEEIDGAAVSRRAEGDVLLVSDAAGVSAWSFEKRRTKERNNDRENKDEQ